MRLHGLDKDCFSNWWSKLPEGSTMLVQPKIDGCPVGLRYKYGQLVEAYNRVNNDVIENIRTINTIPLSIDDSLKLEVELEGILYSPSCNSAIPINQLLADQSLGNDFNEPLLFLAYQIFYSTRDELTDLTQLQKWGFEVPITLRTEDPMQVRRWQSQWINNELFSNFPTSGIVAKCNSSSIKTNLETNSSSLNWSLALKR